MSSFSYTIRDPLLQVLVISSLDVNFPWLPESSSFMSVFTTTSVILDFRAPVRVSRNVILYKIHIFATSTQAGFYQRLLNALTLPLSGVLTSRFILHLRKCEHNLSALERVAVETVNTTAINGDLLSSIIEPQFGWDPVEVDALVRQDLEVADIENTAGV
ncbi:hypothetical protein DFH05DRAFT_1523993 [Lentinula detonsa]|uniref:Uncharacterized protein n=1 Tax=Lentinula detonsa TaxID=2804962 RepID=A0A9W8TZ32_9AGAR|nr:hypothetical protein DFH05DRAFT_1523993 [Lentinula detonsa]